MINRTQKKILQRAVEHEVLRTRHIRGLSKWRQAVRELEDRTALVRVHNGQWNITPRGKQLLDQATESSGGQATLDMARPR